MTAWVDGAIVGSDATPVPAHGVVAPFETMGAHGAQIHLWSEHLARLSATAARLSLPFAPGPELLAAATGLLLQNGDSDGVLRLMLMPRQGRVSTVLTSRPRGIVLSCVRLLPTVVERLAADPPADLKTFPRRFYDTVLQQAQDGGADDGIVVDRDGAVLETALGNLWLRLQGVWVTPPLDGRVLPGIARAQLLARARSSGLPVAERACDLGSLHRAEALAHSNAVYGPRAAAMVGAEAIGVAIVDSELGALWRPTAPR